MTLNVNDILRVLQRMWTVVVLAAALGTIVASVALVVATPRYESTSRIFISTQSLGSAQELLQGSTYTQTRVASYAQVATDPIVLQPVIDEIGLDATPDQLAQDVSTTVDSDSLVVGITVGQEDPVLSADLANAIAEELATVIEEELEAPLIGSQSLVSVSVTRTAPTPDAPVSPSPILYIGLGFAGGLLLGVGLAFTLAAADTRVRSIDDVAKLVDRPLLGAVALDKRLDSAMLARQPIVGSRSQESYRTIRTNLRFMDVDGQRQVLLVTSSIPGEGKTVSSIGLARSIAESGQSVVIVDGDMRMPRLADYFGIEGSVGLSDLLIDRVGLDDALQRLGELDVIPAGRTPPNPAEMLGSAAFGSLLEALRRRYDHIILDSPPIVPVTDAAVLSRQVDGVVLVVAASHVLAKQVEAAVAALDRVDAPLLGVIVNRLPRRGMDAYAQYGYGYQAQVEAADAAATRREHRSRGVGPQRRGATTTARSSADDA